MNWTSIYLKTENLKVFILGTGEVATRRANRFLDKGSEVRLAGNYLDNEIKEKGALLVDLNNLETHVNWADLVIVASGDEETSDYVASISGDKLLNRADFPNEGNIIVPTSFNISNVEISIFTNGKSPLMARQLRKKIQKIITDEDILEIELQDYARSILKERIFNQKDRRELLYKIFDNEELNELIANHKINEAKEYIRQEIIDDT